MNGGPSADIFTTAVLTALAVLALYAGTGGMLTLARDGRPGRHRVALTCLAVGGLVLLAYRWTALSQPVWPPATHVDGLVLVCIALSAVVAILHHPKRVPGLGPFALPVIALLLLWAICAGRWTFSRFNAETIAMGVHLTSVYVGAIFFCVAAAAGAGFLHRRASIRRRQALAAEGVAASLETLERLLVRTAALGFAFLTIAVAAGIVAWTSVENDTALAAKLGWKVALSSLVWGIFGLVMSVRVTSALRGVLAAWMSILGVALLLAAFALSAQGDTDAPTPEGTNGDPLPVAPTHREGPP